MVTVERLKEVLKYDPQTGLCIWLVTLSSRAPAGSGAGWLDNHGYWRVSIDSKNYLIHRLAFLYMTGDAPKSPLDHINGDMGDNKWENLRLASLSLNGANAKKRSDNTSGLKGAHWSKSHRVWVAQIQVNGKVKFLGHYGTAIDAHNAYAQAARKEFGEFARAS